MPKKCKNCGTAVEDTVKICPSCSNLAFEQTAKFELSSEQLQEVAKVVSENLTKKPRVLWGVTWRVGLLVFALLGIPGAITGWNIWSSFDDFKNATTKNIEIKFQLLNQSSSNQIVKAYSDITNDVAVKFEIFAQEANTQIASACYWETGETNKAVTSAKQFSNSSGRWAQWAAAKNELETGDITNATLQLVNVYTNYPTMAARGFIQEGFPVWRKIDWQLFKEKTAQANP